MRSFRSNASQRGRVALGNCKPALRRQHHPVAGVDAVQGLQPREIDEAVQLARVRDHDGRPFVAIHWEAPFRSKLSQMSVASRLRLVRNALYTNPPRAPADPAVDDIADPLSEQ